MVFLAASAHALKLTAPARTRASALTITRRSALGVGIASSFALIHPDAASADVGVKACPRGSNNCWSSASNYAPWRWPAGKSRSDALAELKAALDAYPQEGQADVDKGGWVVAEGDLASSGYLRLEFRSGIGRLAQFFNGGKPFIDDLEVSVGDDAVAVRSSSRVGDSDLGVNAKRLNFLSANLRAKGWDAPALKA